jgi:hypothetical protein
MTDDLTITLLRGNLSCRFTISGQALADAYDADDLLCITVQAAWRKIRDAEDDVVRDKSRMRDIDL